MVILWNIYLLLPSSLSIFLRVAALTAENAKKGQHKYVERVLQFSSQPFHSPHGSGSAPADPIFGPENVVSLTQLLSWPSDDTDRQGVIGEYSDLPESTSTSPEDIAFIARSTESSIDNTTSKESLQTLSSSSGGKLQTPTHKQTSNYHQTEKLPESILHIRQGKDRKPTSSTLEKEMIASHPPFLLPDSLMSHKAEKNSTLFLPAGSGENPDYSTPPTDRGNLEKIPNITVSTQRKHNGTIEESNNTSRRGTNSTQTNNDDSKRNNLHATEDSESNAGLSTTPCKESDQHWTPTYPDDFTPSESPHPPSVPNPALLVPLYSDWNSALATWGFAWEAHIYGSGSIFGLLGLISVVCLLGLPLRCPRGSPYLTMLHFFILVFSGIQAFCLIYDAYSSQDHLPPLITLLLNELTLPCLISAFSLAFLILSLRSRKHLSLPFAMSSSCSALPKPCFLLCMSLLHFMISLACVGFLHFFHKLPTVILLFPQGFFVCLTVFLSCSYLIFYCLTQINTKHIYRLNDNGESGGSSERMQPGLGPFSKVEDWNRAARAGIGTSLCLLGCGGLRLYGILHSLGFGGVKGYGFQAWPWWGYQLGCRLCEIGVCLGLSIIGARPLLCDNSPSVQILTNSRPGSWSRLSCSSPLRGITLATQEEANSPILSTPNSRFQGKQQVVYNVISKRQSEALPLCSIIDSSKNGVDCHGKQSLTHGQLPLPTPPTPPCKVKDMTEPQFCPLESFGDESDSTGDLRPPSPIDLSRSIDQALFSESLFAHSIFGLPRLFHTSSNISLSSPSKGTSKQGSYPAGDTLYRTTSCGNMDQDNSPSASKSSQLHEVLSSSNSRLLHKQQIDWKGSVTGSTQGLCSHPKETGKMRSHSWANRGQHFTHSSLPRAIPHLSYNRRYRTLSLASQDSQASGRLVGNEHLSESKQLEWDLAVQAEFVNVCRQIDALSVCSDTIEL